MRPLQSDRSQQADKKQTTGLLALVTDRYGVTFEAMSVITSNMPDFSI